MDLLKRNVQGVRRIALISHGRYKGERRKKEVKIGEAWV